MDYKKLDELNKLRQSGALTEEEFETEKQKLFAEDQTIDACPKQELPMGLKENSYLALMNFLILVPYIGWILPIVLWAMGKSTSQQVNKQGKYILNWYITWFIFGIIFIFIFFNSSLPFVFVHKAYSHHLGGTMLLLLFISVAITILNLSFIIIGGIKGLNGQAWKYPLSIPFLK